MTDDGPVKLLRNMSGSIRTYRVITKETADMALGGLHTRGTYFKVVDADDWVGEKAFCDLVRTLKTSN